MSTADIDILNRALLALGTRTKVASFSEVSNEAINAALVYASTRDELLRMAPWNCAVTYTVLTLITAQPGTPENPSTTPTNWNKTLPAPPWAYEYQEPTDAIRSVYVVPQFSTGVASGVPITTAITGGVPTFWNGPPARFKVAVDQPTTAGSAVVSAGGSGYAVGDDITLTGGVGVPAVLTVATLAGSAVATVTIKQSGSYSTTPSNPVAQSSTNGSGAGATFTLTYFSAASAISSINAAGSGYAVGDTITLAGGTARYQTQITVTAVNSSGGVTSASIGLAGLYTTAPSNPVAQGSTTGSGTGATFNLTLTNQPDQQVILTNQEDAILCYNKQVTDPNVWDSLFQQAMIAALAMRLGPALNGSLQQQQSLLKEANSAIQAARAIDGNEGLTINDVTPDFIRARGIAYPTQEFTPNAQFDWGPLLNIF